MDVNESQILLTQVKAVTLQADAAVNQFKAISERAEKRQELYLKTLELLQEPNEKADKSSAN
jgi:hypothetical protein